MRWILVVVLAVFLAGCVAAPEEPVSASGGSMGMGASVSGEPEEVMGVVAASGNATIGLAAEPSDSAGVSVSRIVAPADGWLVARSASAPGAVLGRLWVQRGESRDLKVPITSADARTVSLSLHIDRGQKRAFEYDPRREGRNFDALVYTDRIPVRCNVSLTSLGVDVEANSALMLVEDQHLSAGEPLDVRYLIVPAPSWITVHEYAEGLSGARVGLIARPAGEWHEIRVPLERIPRTDEVLVTVYADRGTAGRFDSDAKDPLGSADQPFVSAGVIVSKRVRVE